MRGKNLTLDIQLAGGLLHPALLWPGRTPVLLVACAHFGPALLAGRSESSATPWTGRDKPGAKGDPSTGWWSLAVVTVPCRIAGNGVYQQPQPAVSWGLCSSPCQHWDSLQVTQTITASGVLKSSVVKVNYVYHKIESVKYGLHLKSMLLLLFVHSCHRTTE